MRVPGFATAADFILVQMLLKPFVDHFANVLLLNQAWRALRCPGVHQLSNGGQAICVLLRYLAQMAPDEQEYWSTFEMKPEAQGFIPDSADDVFTKCYYGPVRAKPAWQSEDLEDDQDDDEI